MKCKFCGNQNTTIVQKVQSPFVDRKYTLFECPACKNRFCFLLEHKDISIKKVYDDHALANSKVYKTQFKKNRIWENEVKLIKKLHGNPIYGVLDVGCRTGDFLMHWDKETNCIGVELAKYSAEIARERGLNIKQDFIENIAFSNKFDIVTCFAVLEHLEEPVDFMKKLSALVEDNGILVIMIPAYQSLKEKMIHRQNKRWHMYSPPEHLNFMTYQYINNILKDNFVLIKKRYTTGGMVNIFSCIPVLGHVPIVDRIGRRLMWYWDKYSIFNRYPLFDHMYLYYRKIT